MVYVKQCVLLQLIATFNMVVCDSMYTQDIDYKDTFCPNIFTDKYKKPTNRICAAECEKDPECLAFFYDATRNCFVTTQPLTSATGCVYRKGNLYKSESITMTTTAVVTTTTVAAVPSTTAAVPTTTVADVTSTSSTVPACDADWSGFQGSCYFMTGLTPSLVEADTVCKSHGAHLVFVESEEENQFIATLTLAARSGGDRFYLGITDCDGPKFSYKLYGTTQTAPYINFRSGEGADTVQYSCCVLLAEGSHQQWIDFYCSSGYPQTKALCEK
ncbi:hepatic lectin-like [Mya arenaria]|uniref:hepatic lectin-like n=1 Tax=Mya arenaria TaxID=6604 RepID=UPI0022E33DE0|nr:hepatic lectin-like [Mya arenaria]XP_052818604.1 hepatic lectin-like [Mya arenaria]